jgi:hypothetical protein
MVRKTPGNRARAITPSPFLDFAQHGRHSAFERQKLPGCRVPHHSIVDFVVIVTDHVADAHDATPGDGGVFRSHVGGDEACGLGDARDVALDHLSQTFIGEVVLGRFASGQVLDPSDTLEDVLQAQAKAAAMLHQ